MKTSSFLKPQGLQPWYLWGGGGGGGHMFYVGLNIFTDHSKVVLLLWIVYVISVMYLFCFRACLFIDALLSPAGKGLTS